MEKRSFAGTLHALRSGVLMIVALVAGACSLSVANETDTDLANVARKTLPAGAGDHRISYLESGDPRGRLVVFVHGTPGDARGWHFYLAHVPVGFHYIALDRPGFGQSDTDSAVPSLAEQAGAVARVVEAQGSGPAILVGHSLGGPIVARTAVDSPKLVAALVILAGAFDPSLEHVQFLQKIGDTWPVSAVLPRRVRNANRELIPLKGQLSQLEPLLRSIAVPVFVVHGTKDNLVPFANVAFLRSHLTGARKFVATAIAGQDHMLPWNAKPQVLTAIALAAAEAQAHAP